MKRIAEQVKELQARIPSKPRLVFQRWSTEPLPEIPPGVDCILINLIEIDVDRVAQAAQIEACRLKSGQPLPEPPPRTVTPPPVTPPPEQPKPVPKPRRNGLIYR